MMILYKKGDVETKADSLSPAKGVQNSTRPDAPRRGRGQVLLLDIQEPFGSGWRVQRIQQPDAYAPNFK
jgi:hypothetical protein